MANLCVNARDAIAGVGKVTIETGAVSFDEKYCTVNTDISCGEYVLISISDNGSGMSKEVIEHIFEPFYTTKNVGKGTGLGLSTVYGIVKQNKGIARVYSEPEYGTTFKIYLPRHLEEVKNISDQETDLIPRGSGETILVVEDESSLLEICQVMLEGLGYQVLIANTPDEALRLTKAHIDEIDLLITDVIMPGMNGRQLVKVLSDIKPGIKCIYMSGYTSTVIARQGLLDKGFNLLHKPFLLKDLAFKVRQTLEQD